MSAANTIDVESSAKPTCTAVRSRRALAANDPGILSNIYEDDVNMVIWQRELSDELIASVNYLVTSSPTFQTSMKVTPEGVADSLEEPLRSSEYIALKQNIAELVDMFCCLFELSRVGLRMNVLNAAMCPRFHVDRVPSRLVTTYQGAASEWLKHATVDRTKLGLGNQGLPDHESGLYQKEDHIQHLGSGDVALLKGESWFNNEGAGLVHRSPSMQNGDSRLLLTLDFAD